MAWLFPFNSIVSFGWGAGPQTLEILAGPVFRSLQDLMSISCPKQLKMEPLTNWEWCRWSNVNYGDCATIREVARKSDRWLLLFRLSDTCSLSTSDEIEKDNKSCGLPVCVTVLTVMVSTICFGYFVPMFKIVQCKDTKCGLQLTSNHICTV